jgi:glycosyltransferase involved in cell wall biosynthesis
MYILTSGTDFIKPIANRQKSVFLSQQPFDENYAKNAKIIWCEWGNKNAIEIANFKCDAKKILRIHAYEAFTEMIYHINFKAYDVVIFVAKHIKDYVEKQVGKIPNAVVIPNGVDLNRFYFTDKPKNNKIAYAGYITRKKGVGELILIAKEFPEYEFHVAGKFQEDDVAEYFLHKKPDNLFLHEWQYNLPEFFKDKSFVINTSIRESQGMSVLEAMSMGLKPIINNWVGAEVVYEKDFLYNNMQDIRNILEGDYNPHKYRDFVENRYDFEKIYSEIHKLILEEK